MDLSQVHWSQMHSSRMNGRSGHGSLPPPALRPGLPQAGMFPLHRLSNICCSSGACREVEYWPMGHPQEGWLQLDAAVSAALPLDLFAFSSRGVGVILQADMPLPQGARGLLIMQAHGAGLNQRPVRCCWLRPHPQDPEWQCAGLRFEPNATP
jgi:hypothetical protein